MSSNDAIGVHRTLKLKDGEVYEFDDDLTVEEPLEIHLDGLPYAVTMRMPGDDLHLVAGFCATEGLVQSKDDFLRLEHCEKGLDRVLVELRPEARERTAACERRRDFVSKSSCGLCGKEKMEDIYSDVPPVTGTNATTMADVLRLKADFETRKEVFPVTGSTHQAAVYAKDGECLAFAEDVGRHNALDKAVGRVLLDDRRADAYLVLVSSRLSFEMVQKAVVLGAQVLAGVSAATTLAAAFAESKNLTLVGFLRRNRMNVYTHRQRIAG